MMRFLAGLLLITLCAAAQAAEAPQRVTLSYQLLRNDLAVANVTEALEHDGKRYTLVSEVAASGIAALFSKGSIRRGSKGLVTPGGLRPEIYRDERPERALIQAKFDWGRRQLTLQRGERIETVPLPDPAHDRLSFVYSFAFHLPEGGDLRFAMTDGRDLTQYHYLILGKEHLATPMGNLETLKIAREKEESGRSSEAWFAAEHHWLPVRIRFTEKDGAVWNQVVTAIRYGSAPGPAVEPKQ